MMGEIFYGEIFTHITTRTIIKSCHTNESIESREFASNSSMPSESDISMSITFGLPSFLRGYNVSIIFFFMRRITSLLALLALSAQLIPLTAHAEG